MSRSAYKKHIILISLTVMSLAAISAHLYSNNPEDAIGPLAILDHFYDLTVALVLVAVAICTGNTVCKWIGLRLSNLSEELGVSLFLGTGVIGLLVLLMGLVGWLRLLPISLLIAVLIIFTRRSWLEFYYRFLESIDCLGKSRKTKITATLYFLFIGFLMLRAATPPSAPDEIIYHLSVTNDYVKHGRVYPMFDNSLGNFPFLIHMLYAAGRLAGSEIGARLFSLFLAVGTSLGIFGFCSRYFTRRIGAVAMFAFFGAGMVVEVAVTSRIDVSLAGMLFFTTYAMINYLDSRERGWLWISALFAGFSLGIKHTAVIWLALVGVMYLVQRLASNRDRVSEVISSGIVYTLLAFAVASPWYLKNYVWFHNPVYPLLTGEVADFGPMGVRYFDANTEQRLDAHFNNVKTQMPEVVKAQEEELTKYINARIERHPLRWWEYFFTPQKYLMAEPYHYPNYLFLVIPWLLFVKRPWPRWIVWLLLLSVGFVFAITATSWIARYLLPAYPALTIVAAYTLVALCEQWKGRVPAFEKVPLYVVAVGLGAVVAAGVKSMQTFNSLSYLTGQTSYREAIAQFTYHRPIQFINTQLPANARILVIGAQLTYGIERDYLGDESWFATKWRRLLARNGSLAEVNDDLKRQGFTHVLFSAELFKFAALMGTHGTGGMEMIASSKDDRSEEARRLGPEYQILRNWSTFTMYQKQFLEPIYTDEYHYEIFKIK